MEFVKSNRGSDLLCFEGYIYRLDKKNTQSCNWRCIQSGCKGRMKTKLEPHDGETPILSPSEHCHVPVPHRIKIKKLNERLKNKALTTTNTTREIIREEVQDLGDEASAAIGNNKNLSQTIRRARKDRTAPPSPLSRQGFELPEEFKVTATGDAILLFDSGANDDNRIIIYGTRRMIRLLKRFSHWFIDGTFKICPTIFHQLFTVHVLVMGTVIPCLYGLLPNKSQECYRRFWEGVRSSTPEIELSPESIMMDFELAEISATQNAFPRAKITGCFFHLGQSLWRHIQNFGLREQYIRDEDFRIKAKSLLSLAFLPVDLVPDAFELLTEGFPDSLREIADYFEDIYIGRPFGNSRRVPRHPPPQWNMYERVQNDLPRTNNSVEAWHMAFQSCLQCQHPSIWKLIKSIIRENGLQEVVLQQVLSGSNPLKGKKHYQRVNDSLKRLIEYRNDLPMLDFLRGCALNIELNI